MIGTPQVLSETPRASTDVLSDLLDSMHLSGVVLFQAEFREPWSVTTPESCQLAQVLPFRTEHIIPFHIIASGGCWLKMHEREPIWLREGGAVLLPYGDSHNLSGQETVTPVPIGGLLPTPPWNHMPVVEHGGSGLCTSIVCGFLQCDEVLFHPILRHLPIMMHVNPDSSRSENWLANTVLHAAREVSRPLPGSRSVLPRLAELMFVEILRKHMQDLSPDEIGWFAAFNDPIAGACLRCLHSAPLHNWSVEGLAREVGVSRTVLTERFKYFMDQPPIQYLAHWRLRLAGQALKSSDLPIKAIADHSGYESEAAFSRAFKRHFGLPPGDWRRRQTQT